MANTTHSSQNPPLNTVLAKDVMSTSLLVAHESWSVADLAQFLVSNAITGAPVLDADEHLVGVVSVTDVTRFASMGEDVKDDRGRHGYYTDSLDFMSPLDYLEDASESEMEAATVKDIMTPSVFDVETTTTIEEVAREMVSNGIHRVFVRNESRIVGVVSALDILKLVTH